MNPLYMHNISENTKISSRKAFIKLVILVCLFLILAFTLRPDPLREETRRFMPVDGAYWGMERGDVENLLNQKNWNFEELDSADERPFYSRLKVTADFKPFGFDEIQEMYLFFDRNLLTRGQLILSQSCGTDEVIEGLTERFGQSDGKDRNGLYQKTSDKRIKDFPDALEKVLDLCENMGLDRNAPALSAKSTYTVTEGSLASIDFVRSDHACHINVSGGNAALLTLVTQGDVDKYINAKPDTK